MKIPAVKKLVENFSMDQLRQAESALLDELPLELHVEGADEGEKLTHIFAALWIMEKIEENKVDFKDALRDYTKMVRESIN